MSNITSKLNSINQILTNNGINPSDVAAKSVQKEVKKDGLLEIDQSRKIIMHDNNRQVLTEWK